MTKGEILLLDEPLWALRPCSWTRSSGHQGDQRHGDHDPPRRAERVQGEEIAKTAYCLETGVVKISGAAAELKQQESIKKAYLGG
jgi:ABC-type branched-subunit amino acid transport system ATPase component